MVGNLSRIPLLEVKAYRSSKAHGAADKTASSIAGELGAQRLVEGSIRRMPDSDRLVVTASLLDPQSGQTVWSRKEEPDASSWQQAERTLFELLEFEVRGTIVTPRQVIVEPAAYEDFLRGRYQLNKRTSESALAARDLFQRALERQPSFAAAHAGLADTYLLLGAFLWLPADDMFPKATASARQAIALNDTLAAPHATLGYLLEVHGQWPAAEREFERAIALDPNYATAWHWYALSLVHHDHALAVSQIERAYALDPLSEIIGADVAKVYGEVGRVDEAIRQLERVLSIHPTFVEGQHQLAELLERSRRYAEALAVLEAGARLAPREPRMLAGLAAVYGRLGRLDDARKAYEWLRALARTQFTEVVFLMIAAAGAGDLDGALAYAQRGIEARDGAVVRLLAHDDYVLERFAALRGRPAFEQLIKQAIALRSQ
jgi:tetratricopeptide (TPR) repeat protein